MTRDLSPKTHQNMNTNIQNVNERLIKLPEVMGIVSLGRSSILSAVKRGDFPAPIRLSARAVAWTESLIQTWIAARVKASTP